MEIAVVESPVGKIKFECHAQQLSALTFNVDEPLIEPACAFAKRVHRQIKDYFQSAAYQFDLPIQEQGSEFQRRVWSALREIPAGKVMTYGELAQLLGSSARAVGNACRRNPTPIVVPCHRIVAATGLGGFAGDTSGRLTDIKLQLLRHEKALPSQQDFAFED